MQRFAHLLLLAVILIIGSATHAHAAVAVASVFSDHMVIQRDADAPIWGTGTPNADVTVTLSWNESPLRTTVDADGNWRTTMATPSAGGPHTIDIRSEGQTILVSDVLAGDVWVCSGQSNMEWTIAATRHGYSTQAAYDRDLNGAALPLVRLLTVTNAIAPEPATSFGGTWVECSPEAAARFSAVGFFFGQALFHEVGVPIGLIAADWGGTVAESWTSREGLEKLGEFQAGLAEVQAIAQENGDSARRFRTDVDAWMNRADMLSLNRASDELASVSLDDSAWPTIEQPGVWTAEGLASFDGSAWLRKSITIPDAWIGQALTLSLGPIDDQDVTWVNGVRVGMHMTGNAWQQPRRYEVPARVVDSNTVVIAVRVSDTGGAAGMHGAANQLTIARKNNAADSVSLAGTWRIMKSASMAQSGRPPREQRLHANMPTALWNGMIAPLVPFTIKGAIWYQGESNRGRPIQYLALFRQMIRSWREAWGIGDFPFYFVQIAPFRYAGDNGECAKLREAQQHALQEPNTGMVVTMDIGNPVDIHPTQKKAVGYRLARWALAHTYHRDDLPFSGPFYRSMQIDGDRIRVNFNHVYDGLSSRNGMLTNFEIAGEDKQFYTADAWIDGSSVIVMSSKVPNPVAVRYAWDDDVEPGLKNSADLPAAPFRTDAWDESLPTVRDGRTSKGAQPPDGNDGLTLWYRQPALDWNEALPVGNGTLGAMVFGGVRSDRIQLNEATMWAGERIDRDRRGAREHLDRARALAFDGNPVEAEKILRDHVLADRLVRSHQTLGDMTLTFPGHDSAARYQRSLNLRDAIAHTEYIINEQLQTRETFVSHSANAIVIRVESNGNLPVTLNAQLNRPADRVVRVIGQDQLLMIGRVTQAGEHPGVDYAVRAKVILEGGICNAESRDTLAIQNADAATIVIVAATSYNGEDPLRASAIALDDAVAQASDYKALRQAHINDHRALFDRVTLDLDPTDAHAHNAASPTDTRLAAYKAGAHDPDLEALYFQFGRYLLIASSREGTMPANLQGLWNEHIEAPWNADYHININTQMNYWPAEVTNLAECHQPFFDLVSETAGRGRRTARAVYGCNGWVAHHTTDAWWFTSPVGDPLYGMSVVNGAWCADHLWEHFLFSGDQEFLQRKAWPVLSEAGAFFLDWLVEHPDTRQLVSGPTASPENAYITPDGATASVSMGPSFDQLVIHELFGNIIDAADILGIQTSFINDIRSARQRLALPTIGDDGRILEWAEPKIEAEPGHRHMSHLYGLHPGNWINARSTPSLAEAARRTIEARLNAGGGHTGWSRAWLVSLTARLLDGQQAGEHLRALLADSTLTNLFDSHPPFQIDGNFGGTAGIAEMLIQSHGDAIDLIPALPQHWPNGKANGLRARGGTTWSFNWASRQLGQATVTAAIPTTVRLRAQPSAITTPDGTTSHPSQYNNGICTFMLDAGQSVKLVW